MVAPIRHRDILNVSSPLSGIDLPGEILPGGVQ